MRGVEREKRAKLWTEESTCAVFERFTSLWPRLHDHPSAKFVVSQCYDSCPCSLNSFPTVVCRVANERHQTTRFTNQTQMDPDLDLCPPLGKDLQLFDGYETAESVLRVNDAKYKH